MELLILVAEQGPGRRRGTVLCARPDGWQWSDLERSDPSWRIIAGVQMDAIEVEMAMAPQVPDRPMTPNDPRRRRLERRAQVVDLDRYDSTGELVMVPVPMPDLE